MDSCNENKERVQVARLLDAVTVIGKELRKREGLKKVGRGALAAARAFRDRD